ncbi:FAD-dependent oxidoreductase [Kovacikia minuta CCNUW1]|uniref:hydroxysqualene dehydroxylase n=1 Tax=Kovacikia minuta TaxID=2931930 RepID=UPI001CCA9BBF|nr:FAD-dependent oxidoreductase [Kovacikia minuta]UBF24646.1 FAD-dependent oxidoreductase [Kovacikia minuta CCNUW1]
MELQSPKVVVIGAGWAGLGATYHLAKQGYDVTLLEAGSYPGGLVAGWKTAQGRSVEAGIHGFWYPYRNIFSLINELGINPFTTWTRSSQYSPAGLEVESPIFQDLPRLPTPLGTFLYPQFQRLPLSDRLSALPLLSALVDFDNSDDAWQRYDPVTARELFKTFGVSARLYRDSFEPMLLVGLFAPGEQCSAAAALGMLYFFILAHQSDFDVVWCRGTVGEQIFRPWIDRIQQAGGKVLTNRRVTDLILGNQESAVSSQEAIQHSKSNIQNSPPAHLPITGVVCGDEVFDADAVIFAVGVTGMQKIVSNSLTLQSRREFREVMNLGAIDVLATRLWFDRKISIPRPSNACFGFDATTGWTFFDLNALHDEYLNEPGSVVEVDFYHANQFLPLDDETIGAIAHRYLATCVPAFQTATVIDRSVIRLPKAVTHFAPGSYRSLLPAVTSFENVFMSGDWVITRHGSWSQEKAYVTGLEAANLIIDRFQFGTKATIIPIEPDEPHIQIARSLTRWVRGWGKALLPDFWLP